LDWDFTALGTLVGIRVWNIFFEPHGELLQDVDFNTTTCLHVFLARKIMGRIKKKGQAGQAKNYITRTQAVRKLQVTLPDFRRLCIFKGIYPREPRNLKKANKSATHSTTFYYTKDIQYLLHEPLLAKFREQKTLSKKIARSLGRNEIQDAARLEKNGQPKIKLDHIIRERYPTFSDAVRDLDDALSLLFLFANLPATPTVPPKIISRCQRLCHEFEHYLITTNSLKKSFLSIKGIYYQATIQGQDVMWLVPYRFVQRVTQEVDYRIMGTFVEFYCTLLGFVNFRLYTSIGLVYPPKFDLKSDEKGAELAAFTLEGRQVGQTIGMNEEQKAITNGDDQTTNNAEVQKQVDQIAKISDNVSDEKEPLTEDVDQTDGIDTFEVAAPSGDVLPQPEISSNEAGTLFSNFTIFISREAPRHPIEFLLRAFGCQRVAWDPVLGDGSFTSGESDTRITHQIVDRPPAASPLPATDGDADKDGDSLQTVKLGYIIPGRIYVQPQWVWDCVNEGRLLRPDLYAPGATLPPHLSPWVKPMKGQYDPRATLAEQEVEGEAEEALDDEGEVAVEESDDEMDNIVVDADDSVEEVDGGMNIAGSDDESDEDSEQEGEEETFGGFEEDDMESASDVEAIPQSQHQKELAAEAAGLPFTKDTDVAPSKAEKAKKKRTTKEKKEAEELERQKMMMSRKKRKLFEKMQYGNAKKDAEAEKLRGKRRKIEKSA
jgi:pescadillo protein